MDGVFLQKLLTLKKQQLSRQSITQDHAGWLREIYLKNALNEWWELVDQISPDAHLGAVRD